MRRLGDLQRSNEAQPMKRIGNYAFYGIVILAGLLALSILGHIGYLYLTEGPPPTERERHLSYHEEMENNR